MTDHRSGVLEVLARPLYLLALLLVAAPLVDVVANVWPPRVGDVGWRYGVVGVTSGYVMTPLLGVALACLLAIALSHRSMLRVLVAVCAVAALVLVVGSIDFALDVLQLRHGIPATPATARWSFGIGAAKAMVKVLAAAVILAWFGLAARRALRAAAAGARAPTPPLVARAADRGQ